MKRVTDQKAYVLHRRAYRETSFIVDLLTAEHGRVGVVARGVRKAKNTSQGILQPFIQLNISWAGRGDLVSLVNVENTNRIASLTGECLFAGFYINELMTHLLQKWDPHPELFMLYENALSGLKNKVLDESVLRVFEIELLNQLGYGLFPSLEKLDQELQADAYYRFIPDQGFILSKLGSEAAAKANIFSGQSLLAIARENWSVEGSLQDAKRLTRMMLTQLLGNKTINSRQLFVPLEEKRHG